jgi:hypothetical protein
MSSEEIPSLLRKLHAELEQASSLDAESRQMLVTLAKDLEKFDSQLSTTRGLAARFEAEHPALAATLRQIADTVAKAGI